MKIKDYIDQIINLEEEFEATCKSIEPETVMDLFDRIERMSADVEMWKQFGLTDEDEVPKSVNRIIFPSFELI